MGFRGVGLPPSKVLGPAESYIPPVANYAKCKKRPAMEPFSSGAGLRGDGSFIQRSERKENVSSNLALLLRQSRIIRGVSA